MSAPQPASAAEHRAMIEAIADQMAEGDEHNAPHQREADLEEAEWMLSVISAAGYVVRRAAP